MPHRTIAIGDIHGCAKSLAALIEVIDPKEDDVIVPVGRLRGPGAGQPFCRRSLDRACRALPANSTAG